MTNPYEIWQTRKLLGVYRDAAVEPWHWLEYFPSEFTSSEDYIDFEKLPIMSRKMANFVLPLGRGNSVYDDSVTLSRFKPAYVKVEDRIDPDMPLIKRAGIDASMIEPVKLSAMQRLDLIRAAMAMAHFNAIKRRHNWMAAKAVIDGRVTVAGEGFPTTVVDFQRAGGHTITLGSGSRFGESGVSAVDWFNAVVDTMVNASFGAIPVKATMGAAVWGVLRKDAEFMSHMDLTKKGGNITIERGLTNSGTKGDRRYKVGEMLIGGGSGASIELWVDANTYTDPVDGSQQLYLGTKDIVFTGAPDELSGYQCFGKIIDREANYEPIPIFPKNWTDREGDVIVEYLNAKSAPLMVPIAPNATLKGVTVVP